MYSKVRSVCVNKSCIRPKSRYCDRHFGQTRRTGNWFKRHSYRTTAPNENGDVHEELAEQIRKLWAEWSIKPEVTGLIHALHWKAMLLRTWLRDGEVFVQLVKGKVLGLVHASNIPFPWRHWNLTLCQ